VNRRWGGLLVTLVLAAAAPAFAGSTAAADCFAGLGGALKRGGYGPGVDCRSIEQTIRYVGHTKPWRGHSYYVYQLSWRDKPKGWGVQHGGDKILLFDSRHWYVGYYGDFVRGRYRAKVVGSDIVFDVPGKYGNVIHLAGPHPPYEAWIDRDIVGFSR
jgi:hypothetical protein